MPEYDSCADGTKVLKGATCPAVFTCKSGMVVNDSTQCVTDVKNPIDLCVTGGGVWCADASGKSTGYCGAKTDVCRANPKQADLQKTRLSDADLKALARQKTFFVSTLKKLETTFTQKNDAESVKTIVDLETKVSTLPDDATAFAALDAIRDTIDGLRALTTVGGPKTDQTDDKISTHALDQLKQTAKKINKDLQTRGAQLKKIKAQGVTVPPKLLADMADAGSIIAKIQAAQTYDEARDLAEQLPDLMSNLNDAFRVIENLRQLPSILKPVTRKVAQVNRVVADALKMITKRNLSSEYAEQLTTLQSDIQAAAKNLSAGIVPDDQNLYEYVQAEVIDKSSDVLSLAEHVKALSNLGSYVKQLGSRIRTYDKKVVSLKRSGADTTEAAESLVQLKGQLTSLQQFVAKKIDEDMVDAVIDGLQDANDTEQDLRDALGTGSSDSIVQQLQRSFDAGTSSTSLDQFKVNDVEKLLSRASRFAMLDQAQALSRMRLIAFGF